MRRGCAGGAPAPGVNADVAALQRSAWLAAHAEEVGAAAAAVQAAPAPATPDQVDAARCDALAALGCDREALVTDLLAGETNYLTAAYHLYDASLSLAAKPRLPAQPFGSPLAPARAEQPSTPGRDAGAEA